MGKFIKIGGDGYSRPVIQAKREVIRGDFKNLSPSMQAFFKNSREELRKELEAEKQEKDEQFDIIAKQIAKRLKINKQEPSTTEVTPPEAKEPESGNVSEIIRQMAEVLAEHRKELDNLTEVVETLADLIPEDTRVAKWREGDFALRNTNELSEVEKDQIERKAENIGLNGEVRKIRPYQIIGGIP